MQKVRNKKTGQLFDLESCRVESDCDNNTIMVYVLAACDSTGRWEVSVPITETIEVRGGVFEFVDDDLLSKEMHEELAEHESPQKTVNIESWCDSARDEFNDMRKAHYEETAALAMTLRECDELKMKNDKYKEHCAQHRRENWDLKIERDALKERDAALKEASDLRLEDIRSGKQYLAQDRWTLELYDTICLCDTWGLGMGNRVKGVLLKERKIGAFLHVSCERFCRSFVFPSPIPELITLE